MQNKNEGDYLLGKQTRWTLTHSSNSRYGTPETISNRNPGEKCYFSCQHLQEQYNASQEKPFTMVCTHKNKEVDNPAEFCTIDCEYFARCESCNGFSAVICHSCVRPAEC